MVKQMPPYTGSDENQPSVPVDDVMVKDPHCGVYFPKRDGIRLELNGEELFFCSTECKDKYLADRSKQE
jgi:YHS domain-containing protein